MARNAGEITIDGRELMSMIRITFHLPRAFGLRMTVARWLFRLGGWVSGATVVIDVDDDESDGAGA